MWCTSGAWLHSSAWEKYQGPEIIPKFPSRNYELEGHLSTFFPSRKAVFTSSRHDVNTALPSGVSQSHHRAVTASTFLTWFPGVLHGPPRRPSHNESLVGPGVLIGLGGICRKNRRLSKYRHHTHEREAAKGHVSVQNMLMSPNTENNESEL